MKWWLSIRERHDLEIERHRRRDGTGNRERMSAITSAGISDIGVKRIGNRLFGLGFLLSLSLSLVRQRRRGETKVDADSEPWVRLG